MHSTCSHPEAGYERDTTVGPCCFFRPTVRDRVVQAAIVNVIEPIFERGPVVGWPCWPCGTGRWVSTGTCNAGKDFARRFPRFCPLSPTLGVAFGEDLAVGERAGVRGLERAVWPPHPHPLPRNMRHPKATSLAGEREPETWWLPCRRDPRDILHGVSGRGCKDALRRVDELLKAGDTHVVDADLKGYFDTIPHDRLMNRLKIKIADGRRGRMECRRDVTDGVGLGKPASPFHPPAAVLSLIESFLKANILDGLEEWTPTAGAPQGAVLSPLLSNVYLDPLDHLMARLGFEMVRYADDFVVLCRSAEAAVQALDFVTQWTTEHGLTLHPTKTRIVDSSIESFAFLGYEFRGTKHWPRKKSLQKLKDTVRQKTRRNHGDSLPCVIENLNRTLRGWFGDFKHSSYRGTYEALDKWIRMRLRSLLRRRIHLRGKGRGRDHQRWPNRFFADRGLFSLLTAHDLARQPSLR